MSQVIIRGVRGAGVLLVACLTLGGFVVLVGWIIRITGVSPAAGLLPIMGAAGLVAWIITMVRL